MKRIVVSVVGFSILLPVLGLNLKSAPIQEKENTSSNLKLLVDLTTNHQLLIIGAFAIATLLLLGFILYKIKHESLNEQDDYSIRISGF